MLHSPTVFRYKSVKWVGSVAGLSPAFVVGGGTGGGCPDEGGGNIRRVGVENVDVGDIIADHGDYEQRCPEILRRIGID